MKKILLLSFAFLFSCYCKAQCHFIPSTSTATDTVEYTFSGGIFASYGCAPIDPTYWLNGYGDSAIATFVNPQNYPSVRVWGMNDDDSATIDVNGTSYPLTSLTARYSPKVVCGVSPGPDGIIFAAGKIVGANSNSAGNYSYQDVQLLTVNVSTIKITGISGAGWGFAGVLVNCPFKQTGTNRQNDEALQADVYPNPFSANFTIRFNKEVSDKTDLTIFTIDGRKVFEQSFSAGSKEMIINAGQENLPAGFYLLNIQTGNMLSMQKVVKQ
jgi:hypothetical protein